MSRRFLLTVSLLAAISSIGSNVVSGNELPPAVQSVAIPNARLSARQLEMLSRRTSALAFFQAVYVCSLATSTSKAWDCESISTGQSSTKGDYPSTFYAIHVIVEAVGYGSTPLVRGGGPRGSILPVSTLVATKDLCFTGSALEGCSTGKTLAGELYEYNYLPYLSYGRLFYAQSHDINNAGHTTFTQLLVQP